MIPAGVPERKDLFQVVRKGLMWAVLHKGDPTPLRFFLKAKAEFVAEFLFFHYLTGMRDEQEFQKALKSRYSSVLSNSAILYKEKHNV